MSRSDVDAERLALSGYSFGGYFAPRAAAHEKRIKAVIANSLLPEVKPVLMAMLKLDPSEPHDEDLESKIDSSDPLNRLFVTAFKDRCGMTGKSLAALYDSLGAYSLDGLEGEIKPAPLHRRRSRRTDDAGCRA